MIGIDEVGRGCLAGPVAVGCVFVPVKIALSEMFVGRHLLPPLRDSKKLSGNQRRRWERWTKTEGRKMGIIYATARISPEVIDKVNISNAANLAAWNAFKKAALTALKSGAGNITADIYLDGGLYLKDRNAKYHIYEWAKGRDINIKIGGIATLIKGDSFIAPVMLASIMAKTVRDRTMAGISKKYPEYDFLTNKGYGTAKHDTAIRKHGLCEIHRLTFTSKYRRIKA